MLPPFGADYSTVYCADPDLFAEWLEKNCRARIVSKYDKVKDYSVLLIPQVGSFKIRCKPEGELSFSDHLAMRVAEPIDDKFIKSFEGIGATVADGYGHWVLFKVFVNDSCVGMIHIAYRANPLGA